jgi:ATP-dependent DNA ligase
MDLEGIVAKRRADRYEGRTVWFKVKNLRYTQAEGRGICSIAPGERSEGRADIS